VGGFHHGRKNGKTGTLSKFFEDFDAENQGVNEYPTSSFSLTETCRSASGREVAATVRTPTAKEQKAAASEKRQLTPLSAVLSPSYSWEEFGFNFGLALSHDGLEVKTQKETLFGVSGTAFGIEAQTDFSPSFQKAQLGAEAEFANEKFAVRVKGNYEHGFGLEEASLSLAGKHNNFQIGLLPRLKAKNGEENLHPSLAFGVLYQQPTYQAQFGGKWSRQKTHVAVDWFQEVSADVAYAGHVRVTRANETASYQATEASVGANWKWDADTQLRAKWSVKNDDAKEMRANLAVTQSLTSYCKATLFADVNLLSVTSGPAAAGAAHSFGVDVSLE